MIRIRTIDFTIMLLVLALPWSTSATVALVVVTLIMMTITYGPRQILQSVPQPVGALPFALVGMAAMGMAWSHDTPWPERLHALDKILKLLCIPLFALHFQASKRAWQVFGAYAASNLALLLCS